MLGILKQPSSNNFKSPDSLIISGLINVFLTDLVLKPEFDSNSSLSNAEVSIIKSLIPFPICGAAKPTPEAFYIVSYMSLINIFKSG